MKTLSPSLPPFPLSFVADVISRVAAAQRAAATAAAAVAARDGATVDSGRTEGRTDGWGKDKMLEHGPHQQRCTVAWSSLVPAQFEYHSAKKNEEGL